ncbi:MAG TPA: SUMF1/EgtB/PvdO family nonheme iron enzyme [Phototrophicaceae bacterium]|nr:SUMF1/EgtB/PvdO family nonheme iron enzyme [Phototrophicaceae bacterium]
MAQIFISYSRADRSFLDNFVPLIRKVYGNDCLWYDDDIHGGADWWETILAEIGKCQLFIYLISNEALESPYCQAELREALRLHKLILPVVVRRLNPAYPGNVPDDLKPILARTQYVDLINMRDMAHVASLYAAIHHLFQQMPAVPPPPQTAQPIPQPPVPDKKARRTLPFIIIAIAIGLFGILIVALVLPGLQALVPTPTLPPTTVVAIQNTETPAIPPTPTITPTVDLVVAAQTVIAQQTLQAIIAAATATVAQATQYQIETETQIAYETATATLWTTTPTPNLTPSIEALITAWAQGAATQDAKNATVTATLWTDTPTPTNTPTLSPIQLVSTPLVHNADWMPMEQDFDGVTMVLVPVGCFEMGNDPEGQYWDGNSWIQGVPSGGKQCFEQSFWLDKYEVTNWQFAQFAGEAASESNWTDDNRPREQITWFEANNFCAKRDARLPTEREWEYAARGPDNWVYPWGNDWNPDNVVWSNNSSSQTAVVGSKTGGVSWVGAMDLSGNVWEWVSNVYKSYPYQKDDGREDLNRIGVRVLRGGSWGNYHSGYFHASYRYWAVSGEKFNFNGFRCARSLDVNGENGVGNFVTATPEATRDETAISPVQLASTPVAHNADWTPVEQELDGVIMVLIPVGCFYMGSSNGSWDEKPVRWQCFDQPFWLDKYEVTNRQFRQFGGEATIESQWKDDNRPRESIAWFEARDFCMRRDARLPTEMEWEYAARGPNDLIYPWGNEWNPENVVWFNSANNQTAEVGSRTGGVSWVGAFDLSGNVLEWVNTIYQYYPYQANDGREDSNRIDNRVLRGGAWTDLYSDHFRAPNRDSGNVGYAGHAIGFRCARSIE